METIDKNSKTDYGEEMRREGEMDSMVKMLRQCIAFRSVKGEPGPGMPQGEQVALALEFVLDTAKAMGFETKNIDGKVGYVQWGNAEEIIGVLGHLDVVPEGDNWTFPPFGGEIKDGKLFGRGSLDDKGPMIAALFALKRIKDKQVNLKRGVRLIFGTDEETGSTDMKRYRETEKIPWMSFTPDGNFPVINAEKGLVVFRIEWDIEKAESNDIFLLNGGLATNQVPSSAEAVLRPHLKSEQVKLKNRKGATAHGSTPEKGVNAIDDVIDQIENFFTHQGEEPLSPTTFSFGKMIAFYQKFLNGNTTGAGLGLECPEGKLGASTMNVGTVRTEQDEKGIRVIFDVDYRYPYGFSAEEAIKSAQCIVEKEGAGFSLIKHKQPLFFPENHPLVKTLLQIYREETGRNDLPMAIGGGTYAKSLPNTVAFGPLFPDDRDVMHQSDEYVDIASLAKMTRLYEEAMKTLANL